MAEISIQEKVENRIIDLINEGAGGRLIIFKPQDSDKDLAVEKRSDYKKNPVYLKIFPQKKPLGNANFVPAENFYFLFADFDFVAQDVEDEIWLVPSEKLSEDFSKFKISKKELRKFLL